MRIRKRYVMLAFASVAALAVGGIAFASHTNDNVSTLSGSKITPSQLPRDTFKPASLFVHTGTHYADPAQATLGGKAKTVTLLFDDDGKLNLTGIPKCTATFGSGTTIAAAWERCGPGADTAPEVNAYLSPSTGVSGTISTAPPGNFPGCNLVFKKSSTQLLLFARATLVQNGTADCSSPGTNNSGNTSTTLTGTLSTQAITPDYRTKLTVPLPSTIPLALDDFKSTVKRASVFRGRCRDTNKQLHLRGRFQYTDSQTEQPPDTVTKTKACT
jgi:hypothetical protein